ncbi:hypothetical protein CAMRE0001_2589 [Campylobacter rectus RM3267]|uniref:Uncharacterized protein n=1 Tax=Campylobacter rectus RM3267 TaxID=553218 RepID=B9D417_CAMRE|nr:hypothetical protein CAMRE0001_2589 [Campylobacter rectus RM3267]
MRSPRRYCKKRIKPFKFNLKFIRINRKIYKIAVNKPMRTPCLKMKSKRAVVPARQKTDASPRFDDESGKIFSAAAAAAGQIRR